MRDLNSREQESLMLAKLLVMPAQPALAGERGDGCSSGRWAGGPPEEAVGGGK